MGRGGGASVIASFFALIGIELDGILACLSLTVPLSEGWSLTFCLLADKNPLKGPSLYLIMTVTVVYINNVLVA